MGRASGWAFSLLLSLSWVWAEDLAWLKDGEELTFALSYFHIVAGTMELQAQPEGEGVRLAMTATSTPAFSRFFRVNNRIESLLTKSPLSLLRSEARIEEGKRQYQEALVVDPSRGTAHRTRNGQDKGTVSVPSPVLDSLGAIFALRSFPLAPSRAFSMNVISGRAVYPLVVVVAGRQTVRIAGHNLLTLVVEPRFKEGGLYKRESKLTLYVTADQRHLPVKIVSQLPFGSLTATLTEASPPFGGVIQSQRETQR